MTIYKQINGGIETFSVANPSRGRLAADGIANVYYLGDQCVSWMWQTTFDKGWIRVDFVAEEDIQLHEMLYPNSVGLLRRCCELGEEII